MENSPSAWRNGPQIERGGAHLLHAVGLPVAHVEAVRNDAGAGPELADQPGAQLQIEPRQEIERHDGRIAEVDLEQVLVDESHAPGDAGLARICVRLPDALRVDVDAGPAHAIALR